MNEEIIRILRQKGAAIDEENKRFEIALPNGGCIIGYNPIKGVQIYAFDIRGEEVPDLSELNKWKAGGGKVVQGVACRSGNCAVEKNLNRMPLWANEAVHYVENSQVLQFKPGRKFCGVETIIHPDILSQDMSLFTLMKKRYYELRLPEKYKEVKPPLFFRLSDESKSKLDVLLKHCFEGDDASLVVLSGAELAYSTCGDMEQANSVKRSYVNKSQLIIAEDIYDSLTNHCDEKWTSLYFADKYGYSTTTVKKYFENVYGYEFKEYQIKVRMERAKELLRTTAYTVGEISGMVGYSTHAKFGATFKRIVGVTPLEYRRAFRIENLTNSDKS